MANLFTRSHARCTYVYSPCIVGHIIVYMCMYAAAFITRWYGAKFGTQPSLAWLCVQWTHAYVLCTPSVCTCWLLYRSILDLFRAKYICMNLCTRCRAEYMNACHVSLTSLSPKLSGKGICRAFLHVDHVELAKNSNYNGFHMISALCLPNGSGKSQRSLEIVVVFMAHHFLLQNLGIFYYRSVGLWTKMRSFRWHLPRQNIFPGSTYRIASKMILVRKTDNFLMRAVTIHNARSAVYNIWDAFSGYTTRRAFRHPTRAPLHKTCH